ncbi:MAG: ATP-dependent DNA helicase RecG [Sphingobacteriaceae bacterium]|nr:ATP-dependent DNA helicase RecG [Sphingobacteriaceae bacterium]
MNAFQDLLQTPVEFLKGVGPAKAELLRKELGIGVYEDLLQYFPFRHIDRSKYYKINELQESFALVQLKGVLTAFELVGAGPKQRLVAQFTDGQGQMELIWFQSIRWIQSGLKVGEPYVVFGKPTLFKNTYSIVHPEIELVKDLQQGKGIVSLQPVYYSTEKLKQRGLDTRSIARCTWQALEASMPHLVENLPQGLRQHFQLVDRKTAFKQIHYPESLEQLEQARRRLKFEELFFLQFGMIYNKRARKAAQRGHVFSQVGQYFNGFYQNHLPFELTDAQKRVVKEIREDMRTGQQMNRLLQGDVGSGKTVVALLTMLLAADNGFQACLMAPTEILATQHYQSIKMLLGELPVEVALLTGSTRIKERRVLHEKLRSGALHFLIGTHALIEPEVQFHNLGLTIIDEQHRFGVAQRAKLWAKNAIMPHVMVMTATPIPRTLAMTLYGDLDVSVIDQLPMGRKPIKTMHATDAQRLKVFEFMRQEIAKGRQVYVVYPLIEESEKLDLKDLTDGYESMSRAFPLPNYRVSIVHGKMKPEDKQFEMNRFITGNTHIMVATTVIEVGVNVPNASIMVIENAERFGLSQLHQLRGRVGRGAEQSYCILMSSNKLSVDAKLRLKTMCETNDGFKIAEVDLELRGPGDMAGTQQSGMVDFKIADLTTDADILRQSRQAVEAIFSHDPELQLSDSRQLVQAYKQYHRQHKNWSAIS